MWKGVCVEGVCVEGVCVCVCVCAGAPTRLWCDNSPLANCDNTTRLADAYCDVQCLVVVGLLSCIIHLHLSTFCYRNILIVALCAYVFC